MKPICYALSAAVATLTLGCTAAQFGQATTTIAQAQAGAAVRLATSATIAQMSLVHMAAALSRAATQDFDDGNVPPLTSAPRTDADFTYELDNNAGTGKIARTVGGKRTVDLAFTYESERGNAGMAYTVTGTSGHFEGYQLLFPRLTLLFSAVLGEGFLPRKHTNGQFLFNVDIMAVGSLGVGGVEAVRLSKAEFGLMYPISEGEAKVGDLRVVDRDGSTFDGEVVMAEKTLRLRGAIKSANGTPAFELKTGANGELTLSKSPPMPAAPPAL